MKDYKMKGSVFDFESASFSEFAFSSGGFGEDVLTVVAGDDRLCVAEDNGSFVASSASNVHEIRVGSLYESFELVLLSFGFEGWVK